MKNKYIYHSHISEKKFREIIRLFVIDIEAKKIGILTNITEKTINNILLKIRERIYELAQKESYFKEGEIEIDESYFGPKRVKGKRGRGAGMKTVVFGMKKRNGNVYTQIVKNCSAETLIPIIKENAGKECEIHSDEWKSYDGLVNEGYKKHYRVKHSDDEFVNGKAHVNGIENFWGISKTRMMKSRGLKKKYFPLHLKESEFRFNHRNDDLYHLLLNEFRRNPL